MNDYLIDFIPLIKGALYYTIPLSVISFVVGIFIAIIVALVRVSNSRNIFILFSKVVFGFYISIIRGTPLLVQLFIIFYGLPNIGITLSPFISSIIAFSCNIGAYASETVRASILAVPVGQWEAALTTGLNYFDTLVKIIAPQSFKIALPTLSNTFISTIKDSSLASIVLVTELLREAQIIASFNYEFLRVYTQAALVYWIICIILGYLQVILEKRYSRYMTSNN